jgi:UDP-N-acetylmuramoylalanine--D-glutamate ligase
VQKFKGKKVLVVGLGKSGEAAVQYFSKQGAKVTATDEKTKQELGDAIKRMEAFSPEFELGKFNEDTFTSTDVLFLSPGVARSLPEVKAAIDSKIPVTNDIEILRDHVRGPIIAITGTNGKTTTTTMIGDMLKADGKKVFVCGNIGTAALDYVNQKIEADVVVVEVSSFQCESLTNFRPDVGVLTNLEPNHLDRYPGGVEQYFAAKHRLFANMGKDDTLVLNLDNAPSCRLAETTKAKVMWFTRRDPMTLGGDIAEKFKGSYLKRPRIVYKAANNTEMAFELMGSRLPGEHNRENFMAAINAVLAVGCSAQAIQKTIQEFKGVEHRLEFVRRKDGVTFYNDSKATSVAAMQRSLASFNAPIILIAGGRDKDELFEPLQELVKKKVKNLILVGEAKEKINRALGDFSETFLVGTFEEAVLIAFQKSRNGDIVLFSPGCSSYDMFRNYEERGEFFKKLVSQL